MPFCVVQVGGAMWCESTNDSLVGQGREIVKSWFFVLEEKFSVCDLEVHIASHYNILQFDIVFSGSLMRQRDGKGVYIFCLISPSM